MVEAAPDLFGAAMRPTRNRGSRPHRPRPGGRVQIADIVGVWLATKGYGDDITKEGFQPLNDIMHSFVENGGQI